MFIVYYLWLGRRIFYLSAQTAFLNLKLEISIFGFNEKIQLK